MNCKDVDKLLTVYFEGEATPEEREQVEAHLAACPRCREELEAMVISRNQLRQALRLTASQVSHPPQSWDLIKQRAGIRDKAKKPPPKRLFPALVSVSLSVFLLAILIGTLIAGMGGMAPPPPEPPVVVTDGEGGAIMIWLEEPYGSGLYAQHIDSEGNRLWGEKSKQIAGGDVSIPWAVSDGVGGAIIVWGDRNGSYAQRLDPEGNPVWGSEGVFIWSKPVRGWITLIGMAEDGAGGAILLSYSEYEVDGDYMQTAYTQRINADGMLLWAEDGICIMCSAEEGDSFEEAHMVGDGYGGAVIVWGDEHSGVREILAQRVSSEGKTIWGDGGVMVTTASVDQENPRVISDGTGNFIVAWNTRGDPAQYDVYAQKLDANGQPLWTEQGVLVCNDLGIQADQHLKMQSHPQLIGDGSGGCIVAWRDRRRILNGEIYAQRISATGEVLWAESGVQLREIPDEYPRLAGIQDFHIIGNNTDDTVVVWTSHEDPSGGWGKGKTYAQKLSPNGRWLWSNAGVTVYEAPDFRTQGYSSVVSDGQGGVIIGSRTGEGSQAGRTYLVYAQRIDADGNRIWGEGGLEIQTVPSSPIVQIIAASVILITALILVGLSRDSRLAGILTAIVPVLIGIAGLFSELLLIGPLGYTYRWAYIPNTPVNLAMVVIIPIAGLVIGAVGIKRRSVTKWVMVPVVVFCSIVTVLCASPIVSYLT